MNQSAEPALLTQRAARWRIEAHDVAPFVTLAVLVLYFGLVTRNFYTLATLCDVLRQGAVLAIVSAGLTFVLLCGEIDLSVGMVALLTACLCGVLFESPWAAGKGARESVAGGMVVGVLVVPLLCSLALGVASGLLTVASRLPSFIITLAMMNIAQGLARYVTQSEKFAVPQLLRDLGNAGIDLQPGVKLPYSAMLAAAILVLGHLVLRHTRFGRFVYMTGGNREAARLAGVRTGRIIVGCLALCAVAAGAGGLVNAGRLESVSQDQNADLLLNAVACVVLGGTSLFGGEGGMGRTALGVVTFSVLQVGLNRVTWINDLMRPFLMGVVLMVALVINGLLARKRLS